MANDPRFYLVVVRGGVAEMVPAPAVLRGRGLERYGEREDLLTTLQPGGSASAVVLGEEVIALGDPRVAQGTVAVDDADAQVLVVSPDGEVPPDELQDVARWLAFATVRAGGGWTTKAPSTDKQRRGQHIEGAQQPWLKPIIGLSIGLFLGGLIGSVAMGGDHEAPPKLAIDDTQPVAHTLPTEATTTVADPPAETVDKPLVVVAAPTELTETVDAGPILSVSDADALAKLTLWDGEATTPAEAIQSSCNSYGDLVLTLDNNGETVRKTVVCGRFHRSSRGKIRRSVCVPSLRRCALLANIDPSLAPAYICTPLSGRAYGLMKVRGKSHPHYRNGRSQAGFALEKPPSRFCGRRAKYARALRRL